MFLFLVALLQIPFQGKAQDESAIRPIIEAKDLKKLIKADDLQAEAEKILSDNIGLEKEILNMQQNTGLSDREIKRKTEPLAVRIRQKHVQASSLYEKCNELKFVVYKKYLDKFWKEHSGEEPGYLNAKALEEQASDVYFQAAGNRMEAKHMNDGDTKTEKLKEADSLEVDAIHKQLYSLGACYGITLASSGKAEVQPPGVTGTAEPKPDGGIAISPETQQAEINPAIAAVVPGAEEAITPLTVKPEQKVQPAVIEDPVNPEPAKTVTDKAEVSYRVQLIASRVVLTKEQIAQAYKGNEPVEIMEEAGWYKYQLNGGNSLKKAQELKLHCGIPGAFIVPYRNGVKITFKEAAQP
jgi:hypothetical protein